VATNYSLKAGVNGVYAWRQVLVVLAMLTGLSGLPIQVSAAWEPTFIEGINAYGTNATIGFANSAYLFNAPNHKKLPAVTVFDQHDACVAGNGNNKAKQCKATTPLAVLPSDRLAFSLCASASNTNIGPPSFAEKTVSVPQGEYGNISLEGGPDRTVKFTTADGIYKMKTLSAAAGRLELSSGQYWIETLTINSGVNLVFPTTGNVTLFVKNSYTHENLNLIDKPERLLIYNYGDFVLNGSAELNAYVLAEGKATLNGSASLTGAITSNQVRLNGGSSVVFADTVANVTTAPNCTIPAPPAAFHLQFGQSLAGSNNVRFDKPFEAGVTPLIFPMATVSQTNSNNDGPAAVFVSNITKDGFSWTQKESPSPQGRYVTSQPMPSIDWIAVSPGTHALSNGKKLIAGSVDINQAIIGNDRPYTRVTLPAGQNVVLNQLQSQNNNCWLTSTSQFSNNDIELALDSSEVRTGNSHCQPGSLNNNQLQNETVAYLAVESGTGTLNLNNANVKFHFGNGQTHTGNATDLATQCNYLTSLTGFDKPPTFIAAKTSRNGGDGGWLRRCQLSASQVSMVVDEDTYSDSDRRHIWEDYSFVAIEKLKPVRQCFTDKFDRTDLGSDWVVARSSGDFTPAIVGNRLRQTQATSNQATSTTYQRLFPAKNNKVEIEFDHYAYGGTGADGIAFVLSDASITPQPGAAGGPMGYGARSNVNGFSGGWLGFGIDEYGNFSAEGGPNGPGRRPQSVSIRGSGSGTSGYPYLRGTCSNGTTNAGSCLSPTVDKNNVNPAHRYRITVDSLVANQSIVKVERNTGSGFIELIPAFDAAAQSGQKAIPENFLLSLTGSTGGSTNNHEIDNVDICAFDSNPIGVQIDHFEYSYSGQGITCTPKILSIKACANGDCTQTVADTVTATLSPITVIGGGGWVGGNVITFTGGQKSDLQLRRNTPGTVTLGVTGSTPSTKAFSKTLCRVNGGAASEANCGLVFADSGFIFDVPDKLANKPTGNISISAVKKSDSTLQCVPTFASTTKNVGFWSTYVEPTTAVSGQSISVNATAVSKQSSAATTLALAFDAEGKANINVNYPDSGKMQLDAKYTGIGDEQGLILLGSDQFVSFPVGLCVKAKDSNASCNTGNASCNVYKKSAETFELIIQGKAWQSDGDNDYCDNLNTPNYAHNDIALGHSIVAPLGGALGVLGNVKYTHLTEATSSNTVSQSVSEVGVFKFTATQPASYLGASYCSVLSLGTNCTMPNYVSSSIGRFVPASFEVSDNSSRVSATCGTFSYMDQGFDIDYTLVAKNKTGVITQNYIGAFAKASISLAGENANNGVDLSSRLTTPSLPNAAWDKGVATIMDTTLGAKLSNFSRLSPPLVDGPFESLALGLKVQDNDGDHAKVVSDMHAGSTDLPCGALCDAKSLGTPTKLRHGRVTMDNTYGPESETLLMPTYAQYWNGSAWVVNSDDSCSNLTPALDSREQYGPALTSGQVIVRDQLNPNFVSGSLNLNWRNTTTNLYRGQVTAPLSVQPWLKWYWDSTTTGSITLADPKASAFFGRYRGHDRIIYWRETE
jgi:MSHA biogenesis protein MshQ